MAPFRRLRAFSAFFSHWRLKAATALVWIIKELNLHISFQSISDIHFANMADGSQPEKRLKLGNSNNGEQDEIRKLKKVVRELEESLASKNQNLLEMEQSKHKAEREKVKVKKENEKLEREKNYFEEKYMKLEEDKNKIEEKLQKLVECPVCLTLPREGPVPCCVKGHFVCSPCLGKLRKENKLEQG